MLDSIGTHRRRTRRVGPLVRGLMVAMIAFCGSGELVRADDYVDEANRGYEAVAVENRSDLVILPLLIELEDPPIFLRTAMDAALLPAESVNWAAAATWAEAEPQQALIEALGQVTGDTDFRTAMQFAQPYGIEGVAGRIDLIAAGLYTDLGDPPTLAAARHGYMPAMQRLELLAHVEATRLLATGDAEGALDHMINWAMFCRQFADRRFVEEKRWAMGALHLALQRLRDLAYRDFKSAAPGMDAPAISEDLERIELGGYLSVSAQRLAFPIGNLLAAEQLLKRIIDEPRDGGKPDPEEFARTMSQIASGERPLRLFAEAAFWRTAAGTHAGWHESLETAERVGQDWQRRWEMAPDEQTLTSDTDFARMLERGGKFSVIAHVLRGMEDLFPLRRELVAELAGTRLGLAHYAYTLKFGTFAPVVTSVRPIFLERLERDPYSAREDPFQYFVPVKDTPQGPRGEIVPWNVEVFPPDPYSAFLVPFTETEDNIKKGVYSDFILYSVGLDNQKGRCQYVTQADPLAKEGDYIFWPPLMSMLRKRLMDAGELE